VTVDEILAHHEAGHAVAALELHIPFTDVTLAKVRVPPNALDLTTPFDIERDAVFTLAGECAESLVHEELGHASESDRRHLEELSVDRYPDEPDRRSTWKSEMEDRANALVLKHWGKVQRLAEYLLIHQTVSRARAIEHLQRTAGRNVQSIVWDQ